MNLEKFREAAQRFVEYCEIKGIEITPENFEIYHKEQMEFIDKMLNKEGGLSDFGSKVADHLYSKLVF